MPTISRYERILWAPTLTLLDADKQPVTPAPAVTAWQASFDDGLTWHNSREHPDHSDWPCWLIQGDAAPAGDPPDATLTGRTRIIIRYVDSPEVVVSALTAVIE